MKILGGAVMAIVGFLGFFYLFFWVVILSGLGDTPPGISSGGYFILVIPLVLLVQGIRMILKGIRKSDEKFSSKDVNKLGAKKAGIAILGAVLVALIQVGINEYLMVSSTVDKTYWHYFFTPSAFFVYLMASSVLIKKYYLGYSRQKALLVFIAVFVVFNILLIIFSR